MVLVILSVAFIVILFCCCCCFKIISLPSFLSFSRFFSSAGHSPYSPLLPFFILLFAFILHFTLHFFTLFSFPSIFHFIPIYSFYSSPYHILFHSSFFLCFLIPYILHLFLFIHSVLYLITSHSVHSSLHLIPSILHLFFLNHSILHLFLLIPSYCFTALLSVLFQASVVRLGPINEHLQHQFPVRLREGKTCVRGGYCVSGRPSGSQGLLHIFILLMILRRGLGSYVFPENHPAGGRVMYRVAPAPSAFKVE